MTDGAMGPSGQGGGEKRTETQEGVDTRSRQETLRDVTGAAREQSPACSQL